MRAGLAKGKRLDKYLERYWWYFREKEKGYWVWERESEWEIELVWERKSECEKRMSECEKERGVGEKWVWERKWVRNRVSVRKKERVWEKKE